MKIGSILCNLCWMSYLKCCNLFEALEMAFGSVACCCLAFILYYNSLDAGFVYDDRRAILSNPDVLPSTPVSQILYNDFWGTALNSTNSHGSYRPLCVYSFRLNYQVCGFRPWGYHMVNVLLHVLATALIIKVFQAINPSKSSNVAGLIFASHPIHTEAVSGVVGRADILSCIFFQLSFLCYVQHTVLRDRYWKKFENVETSRTMGFYEANISLKRNTYGVIKTLQNILTTRSKSEKYHEWNINFSFDNILGKWTYLWLTLTFAGASMLSKESGITVLAVCAVYDILRSRRIKSKKKKLVHSIGFLGIALCGLLLGRLRIMGQHSPEFSTADNPTAKLPSIFMRTLNFLFLPVVNLRLLLYP